MQNEHEISFVSNLITDTNGALILLSERAGRSYSRDTLRYHVTHGNLAAYVFDGTSIVRWDRNTPTHKGKEYIFLKKDIAVFPLESKAGRKPKS